MKRAITDTICNTIKITLMKSKLKTYLAFLARKLVGCSFSAWNHSLVGGGNGKILGPPSRYQPTTISKHYYSLVEG